MGKQKQILREEQVSLLKTFTVGQSLTLASTGNSLPIAEGGAPSYFSKYFYRKKKNARLQCQKTTLTLKSQSPRSTKGHTGCAEARRLASSLQAASVTAETNS
jgi:hypothetical protein